MIEADDVYLSHGCVCDVPACPHNARICAAINDRGRCMVVGDVPCLSRCKEHRPGVSIIGEIAHVYTMCGIIDVWLCVPIRGIWYVPV